MRRHMQNISFLAIIATLMGCAFFFSQQNNNSSDDSTSPLSGAASVPVVESVVDVPDCASADFDGDVMACLSQAVEATQTLLDSKLDAILALTMDSNLRIKLVDSQMNWEDSRDADCDLLRGLETDSDQKDMDEMTCLREANLERLDYLNLLYCEIAPEADCTID